MIPHSLIAKMILAVVLGGAIGIERELRSKSAGFRTLTLVCLGATLFTVFSLYIGRGTTPDRIASNVVVGIGFMGAGVIFRSNSRVNGITTAASMWLCSALGIGIGCGQFFAATIGCLLIVGILFLFSFVDKFLDSLNQVREYKIEYPYEENHQHKFEEFMAQYGLNIKSRSQTKIGNMITGEWVTTGSEKKHHAFIDFILKDHTVAEFSF
jgi:putative Mg2+ transporter-C (MgtC) family protein